MSEWAARYIGVPYEDGVAECWHLAARVWREEFGFEAPVTPAHGSTLAARRLAADETARPFWRAVEAPQEGDAVVMARGRVACHVGVYAGAGRVLHCIRGAGTILTEVRRLGDLGYRLVGYWRRA